MKLKADANFLFRMNPGWSRLLRPVQTFFKKKSEKKFKKHRLSLMSEIGPSMRPMSPKKRLLSKLVDTALRRLVTHRITPISNQNPVSTLYEFMKSALLGAFSPSNQCKIGYIRP
jgi:hypothetical protein